MKNWLFVLWMALFAVCGAKQLEIDLLNGDEEEAEFEIFTIEVDDDVSENEEEKYARAQAALEEMFREDKNKMNQELIDEMQEEINNFQVETARPGKLPAEMSMHLTFGTDSYGQQGVWSPWSCCQRRNNQQTRSRDFQGKKEIVYKTCYSGYCSPEEECKDTHNLCRFFPQQGCKRGHSYFSLMEKLCAKTCKLCGGSPAPPTAPKKPIKPASPKPAPVKPNPPKPNPPKPNPPKPNPIKPITPNPSSAKPTQVSCHSPANTMKLFVFTKPHSDPILYRFSTSPNEVGPWKRQTSTKNGEITSLSLYKKKTAEYNMAIYFCRGGHNIHTEKWQVHNTPCPEDKGWKTQYVLYASAQNIKCSKRFFAAKPNGWPWSSRVSSSHICCKYTNQIYAFYGPDMEGKKQVTKPSKPQSPITRPTKNTPKPAPANPRPPPSNPRPAPSNPRPAPSNPRPAPSNPRPAPSNPKPAPSNPRPAPSNPKPAPARPQPSYSNLSPYNQECLDTHNFFRAIHGVPALRWSVKLARSAQLWAEKLVDIAPENPGRLRKARERTRNWPHSDSNSNYRGYRVGENIAWDMSGDGSDAEETVVRWYAEIFYYDRRNPTRSRPQRPVGHLTQLLWKETTEVGCGVAVHHFKFQNRFNTRSTYSVAHYNPTGNVHYPRITETNNHFDKMVPTYNSKSCLTSNSCAYENQCMAFGNQRHSSCACGQSQTGRRQPTCTGDNGCIAWCKRQNNRPTYYLWKEECKGKKTCKCISEPVDGVAGAICD